MPLKKEKVKEDDDTERYIKEGRKYEIKAAIVRVMKARQTLKEQELINEVVKVLLHRFNPEIPMIKVRTLFIRKSYIKFNCRHSNVNINLILKQEMIARLLDEEDVLETVDGEPNTYAYVA